MVLRITVPSRIHVSLVDLGVTGYRRNGGIGFCIDAPTADFLFEKQETIDLTALLAHGFSASEVSALSSKVSNARDSFGGSAGVFLKNVMMPQRHTGLGIGTATVLACLEAICCMNGNQVEANDLICMSGRGGTSGIGVHGYFTGGFIFDAGRRYDAKPLLSSDDIDSPTAIPLMISQAPMPNWPIGLFSLPNASPVNREIERHLFASVLPLAPEDVFKTAYHVVFGAVAALNDNDFDSFCGAINAIQDCAWKQNEIRLHGMSVQHHLNVLKQLGCDAVGLSSVGPTLYFLAKDFPAVVKRIRQNFPQANVITAFPSNHGRVIIHA